METVEQEYNPFADSEYELDPNQISQAYKNNTDKEYNPFVELEAKESWGKAIIRTLLQIPKGMAQANPYNVLLNLSNMIAQGEALDPEEIDRLREISDREGVPFDEDLYVQALQTAIELTPTVSNISREIEDYSREARYLPHIPLEAKNRWQQAVEFASSAGKMLPAKTPLGFRGTNVALPRPVLGAGISATAELGKELGVPEIIADIASFGIVKHLGGAGVGARQNIPPTGGAEPSAGGGLPPESPRLEPSSGAPPGSYSELKVGTETKPSGLTTRQFEKLKQTKEVPESTLQKINTKLENDFKGISDKIIAESPVGETAKNLKNDPTFKQASRELLEEAQTIADGISKPMPSSLLREEYANMATKNVKGFALSEYDKAYLKYMKEAADDILTENVLAGQGVEHYRKNNGALSEYFEPGASKALNRAKRDALLDQNRAIASSMEKAYPESELVQVFKDGNARWTKIMDTEAIDEFITDVFKGEKIDYKKLHDFFDKQNYGRIFKRSLGEQGYKEFEQLMKDMLTTEAPYRMLKVAKKMGWDDMYKSLIVYATKKALFPYKVGWDVAKYSYKSLINAMLDKPQLAARFNRVIKNVKKGDFKAADREFKAIEPEILPKEERLPFKSSKAAQPETEIEITPERIESAEKAPETPEPKAKAEAPKEPARLEGPIERKQIEHKKPEIKPAPPSQYTEQDYNKLKEQKAKEQFEEAFFTAERNRRDKEILDSLPNKEQIDDMSLYEARKKHESLESIIKKDYQYFSDETIDKVQNTIDSLKNQEDIMLERGAGRIYKKSKEPEVKNDKKALEAFRKKVEKKWPSGYNRKPTR